MKVRTGFVSNSSSSSYIIGVGKLTDSDKFLGFCAKNGIADHSILTTKEIIESGTSNWNSHVRRRGEKTYFMCDSFDGNEVSIEIDPDGNELFVMIHFYGDEGDSCFSDKDDWDPNYDIDSDFFDASEQAIFDIGEDCGVEDFTCTCGAGRNG